MCDGGSWIELQSNGPGWPQGHGQIALRPGGFCGPLQIETLHQHGGDQAHFEHGEVLAEAGAQVVVADRNEPAARAVLTQQVESLVERGRAAARHRGLAPCG